MLLDYLFLPMAIWLIGAAYLHSAFPAVPNAVWVLAFIGVTTTINIVGLRLAKNVNGLLMLVQFLVLGASSHSACTTCWATRASRYGHCNRC